MHDDDVWGSDDEEGDRRGAASELDQEWQARQNQFHTLGYRDGVEAGKNASVQEGFNVGYAEATVAGFNWGLARGLTTAFAALPGPIKEHLIGSSEARARLEALDASIRSYSSTDAQKAFYQNDVRAQDAVSMAGLNRLPETQSVGVWEAGEREQVQTVATGEHVQTVATGEHVQQLHVPLAADGRSELEELERSLRSELEVASVKICDVLVGV